MANRQGISLERLLHVLDDPRSVPDLQRYYTGPPPFTGGRFELLAGGGDRPDTQNVITADDLVAVEMLSVQVPPRVALDLLEGSLGDDIARNLREIPANVDLGADGVVRHVKVGSPADTAWRLLEGTYKVGWVTAGKLLARKRPRLIPVFDSVVSCTYQVQDKFWLWLDGRLREQDGELARRLAALRGEADLPEQISALRVLDVVLWMRHHEHHTGHRCAGLDAMQGS